MYSFILLTHVLAATIWAGGHLVLAATVLPRALKARDPDILLSFEAGFERIGMPALVVQVLSGLWLAHRQMPDFANWIGGGPVNSLITLKLVLLTATVLTTLDARFRIIPTLSAATLPAMAVRIVIVTVLAVGFVVVGVSFRTGMLS